MKYRCIIFDCDGTLLDTLGDIAAAMNKALAFHGFAPAPQENYRDMVGWGIFRLAELVLPQDARNENNIKLLADHAAKLMGEQPEGVFTKPYPGIPELLTELSQLKRTHPKKLILAVLSNKTDAVLRQVIYKFFAQIDFDAVCGMRPGAAGKPDPSMVWDLLSEAGCLPQDTIFVGDSEIDIETAKNAGCYPLGVSWGFRSRETLEKAGAARIIDQPDELLALL